ncbi:apolipophorins-like [Chrysoperla carnea]|uniref:apolipophorins-like n=1 Tax=Chrysoperla carnea TaxID=189513 RepID=UPI001D06D05C|nr:apolipophorins-like [Chrysoperla carnea]
MNNEPRDDHLASTKRINNNSGRFAQSWSLQPKKCRSTNNQAKIAMEPLNENLTELCEAFFRNKVSPLNTCFPIVNALPYFNLCMNYPNGDNRTSCTAAVAYMEACKLENTPLRIPDVCVQCQLINGTEVPEGQFLNLDAESVPKSADIVFIVEAKECNANISTKRNINQVVSLIQKELTDLKLANNRYALVVFGGPGIYSEPRSIIVNNQIFTTSQVIPHYFENIPTGNGSSDIFHAISFAKELIFRPGVSKTMILLPCIDCQADNMKLDYPVLHQLLRENDITLHILMNNDFVFPKSRINKIFYGIDSNTAYTKKDVKELKGDAGLRRQVKLPKADLGFCSPLALETNGSVFTATKLQNDKRGAIKKFATVFAKRVAQSAIPNSCQTCECTANSDGASYIECLPCEYPTALSIDYNPI